MLERHRVGEAEWIDVVDPSEDELHGLITEFHLDGRALDEAYRRAARPTMQRYDDHVYVVAFTGKGAEIDMYLGPEWFITIHSSKGGPNNWDPKPALDRCFRRTKHAPTSSTLMAIVFDELIDSYFDATDAIEDRVESLEDGIFADPPVPAAALQADLFGLRRELLKLRREVAPLREVLNAIVREDIAWFAGDALIECRYAFDKLLRAIDVIDEQRDLLGNAVDAHLAVMSNQMNLVMKKLTAWGSIVFGATLIAGIYGMNFTHMPELHWYYGYPLALGSMLVLSALLYRMFRRRDWV